MGEAQSTQYALLKHNHANTDRQLLANGVAGGTINRGEFHTLAKYHQQTEFLRARLREGGYSPAEVRHLEARMDTYRRMQKTFTSEDIQLPVYRNGSAAERNLDHAFTHAQKNGNGDYLQHRLNRLSDSAYAAGMEVRRGPVYQDERRKARVRGQEIRDQLGIRDRPQGPRPNRPTPDNRGARAALNKLNSNFDKLDKDRNGNISRAELRAILTNPEAFGYSHKEAAALYKSGRSIANIDGPRNGNEDISRADLTEKPTGMFGRALENIVDKGKDKRRESVESRLGTELAIKGKPLVTDRGLFGPNGRPDPMSIHQNGEGSCWLLAGMSQLKPEQIQQMVQTNDKGQVVVHFPGRKPEVMAPLTEAERRIYSTANGDWSAYMEKAAAQAFEREGRDINGGRGHQAFSLLTGRGGRILDMQRPPRPGMPDLRDPAALHQMLTTSLANGQMITAGTTGRDFERGTSNLSTDGHAYAVVGYNPRTGMVTLRNPWGQGERADRDRDNDGLFTMSLRDFQVTFSDMDVQHPPRRGLLGRIGQQLSLH